MNINDVRRVQYLRETLKSWDRAWGRGYRFNIHVGTTKYIAILMIRGNVTC